MASGSVTGTIVNNSENDGNYITFNIWSGDKTVSFPQKIPSGKENEFTHDQLETLPCGAVVYRTKNRDGNFNDWMISWNITSSDSHNKVSNLFLCFREILTYGENSSNIYSYFLCRFTLRFVSRVVSGMIGTKSRKS